MSRPLITLICAILFVLPSASSGQENRVVIDKSKIPLEANDAKDFVSPGWVIEEQLSGDLTGDSLPDIALKLIQENRAKSGDTVVTRHRALVILSQGQDGKLRRAAVAGKLLQCTACGAAFYGTVEAPANVRIEKGMLIVSQEHGSRNVVAQTFRFRYDPKVKKFMLIGLDVRDRDRANGEVIEESTNYLTGQKTTKRFRGGERTNQAETRTQGGERANQAETLTPSGQGPKGKERANQAETLTPSGQGPKGKERANQAETLRLVETKTTTVAKNRISIEEVDWEK